MGLEDFERELAEEKGRDSKDKSQQDEGREHKSRPRHHHRSHRHKDESRDNERRHRHKRHRGREDDGERKHRKRQRSDSPKPVKRSEQDVKVFDSDDAGEEKDEWVEKEADTAPPEENILDQRDQDLKESRVQRDAWMQEPSALDIDYVQRNIPTQPKSQFVGAKQDHEFKVHQSDVNHHLADLERDVDSDEAGGGEKTKVEDEPAQHEVSYTIGDSGSSWRMTKLKAVYRQAEETGRTVDDVALERYGNLRDFDDAREEERELDRRKSYGREYVGLEKPPGELFQERKMKAGIHRSTVEDDEPLELPQGETMPEASAPRTTVPLDSTALNKLKAQLMKAKLRNASNAAHLEEEYKRAEGASLANTVQTDVVVLNQMDNRQLAGDRSAEVNAVSGKRGRERGLVTENEDMSIADMVRQEKRTRHSADGESRNFAERIAKDGKFSNDLDYMDDNATKLSEKVVKSDTNLRNVAINDFQKTQKILSACPLCHHDDRNPPDNLPTAPIVSLATRTYLTLPTTPEIAKGGAVIVPLEHRRNLLECDDDEWEEVRNFMKSLIRHYDAQGKSVIFYESAVNTSRHAALNAVPLPHHLAEQAPAYFKEAILASDEQWTQHKPIIDTLALSRKPGGHGKMAWRKSMVSTLPYFHVWFSVDGGLGHVVEDERRWPKGERFAREILGGMLDVGVEVVRKEGRWERGGAEVKRRAEGFRKGWVKWDWTKVLMEAQ